MLECSHIIHDICKKRPCKKHYSKTFSEMSLRNYRLYTFTFIIFVELFDVDIQHNSV